MRVWQACLHFLSREKFHFLGLKKGSKMAIQTIFLGRLNRLFILYIEKSVLLEKQTFASFYHKPFFLIFQYLKDFFNKNGWPWTSFAKLMWIFLEIKKENNEILNLSNFFTHHKFFLSYNNIHFVLEARIRIIP